VLIASIKGCGKRRRRKFELIHKHILVTYDCDVRVAL
jgi:hypothetical protein